MYPPHQPPDEPSRLAALHRLGLLDTSPDPRFDRFVRLARRLLGTSGAAVSLIDRDRQWFKARDGFDVSETSRDVSFCGHTILGTEPLVVADAKQDPRFEDNPLVTAGPELRFYAGMPLALPDGHVVGTLCVVDDHPRTLEGEELQALRDLASLAQEELGRLHESTMDTTTGLLDRDGFDRASESLLKTCTDRGDSAVLFHVSLDLLELIDEAHGHEEGEKALSEMGNVLSATFRRDDLVARIGSEHFCALCPGATHDDVRTLTRRVERRIEAANVLRGPKWPLTFQIAYALWEPGHDADWMELLALAHPDQPRLGNTPEPQYRR